MSTIGEQLVSLYTECRELGLPVSLTLDFHDGQERFSLYSQPASLSLMPPQPPCRCYCRHRRHRNSQQSTRHGYPVYPPTPAAGAPEPCIRAAACRPPKKRAAASRAAVSRRHLMRANLGAPNDVTPPQFHPASAEDHFKPSPPPPPPPPPTPTAAHADEPCFAWAVDGDDGTDVSKEDYDDDINHEVTVNVVDQSKKNNNPVNLNCHNATISKNTIDDLMIIEDISEGNIKQNNASKSGFLCRDCGH